MRVRPLTVNRPRSDRRPFAIVERPATVPAPAPASAAEAADHPAERRHRACVSPQDSALYTCGCGVAFQAAVSTSVACPSCGADQAW
ncbi:hypothetical protein [Baekduia sp. Peel2402]|uniref:hypothetical protein n=1 Tax=Baekduia sp. Peel2402 TaxID=3458296 RepID=UPI00403ECD89